MKLDTDGEHEMAEANLNIQLSGGTYSPDVGATALNTLTGGPGVLLNWLETQLGLQQELPSFTQRVAEYADALSQMSGACYERSLDTDRWSTATELVLRRDQLMLEGWDGKPHPDYPALVQDLARVEDAVDIQYPNVATRLRAILNGLNAGQQLTPHTVHLAEKTELWPKLWQELLHQLNVNMIGPPVPAASADSSLAVVQKQCVDGHTIAVSPDESLRWLKSTSAMTACEFIASVIKSKPELATEIVVCCEDDSQALCLDGCLSRAGLPTMGTMLQSRSHPVLQILPLALGLCWEPVDPYLLLDFLTLPVSPIPRKVASELSNAMLEQPGYRSAAWDKTVEELRNGDHAEAEKFSSRIGDWLDHPKVERGSMIPIHLIAERCRLLTRWASAYARRLEQNEEHSELARSLRIAAWQSTNLEEIVAAQRGDISEAQLIRLRDAALADSGWSEPYSAADGGPRRIRNMSELVQPCDCLVWLGTGTDQKTTNRWTTAERNALQKAGLDIDDGHREVTALRQADRRGIHLVRKHLLAIQIQGDVEKRPHPLWLQIEAALTADSTHQHQPLLLDDVIKSGHYSAVLPWAAESQTFSIRPAQQVRRSWQIDSDYLQDRAASSYSSLESRLGCPLKWVLNYQARLRPGPISQLPSSFTLKGSFCHSLLEKVFGVGGVLPSESEAQQRVEELFEERLPLDAAPLAQPHCIDERQSLKHVLLNATRVLVRTLTKGGYTVQGFELKTNGTIDGRNLDGFIDCLVESPTGSEAIIDFKFGGHRKYRDHLVEGRAVQLATYAECRRQNTGDVPDVAYLILSEGLVYTPQGSRISGAGVGETVEGPSIDAVWGEFLEAIHQAEGWLQSGDIPVRPHQPAGQWPDGANLVLAEKLPRGYQQPVCRYCDYKKLCGLEVLE